MAGELSVAQEASAGLLVVVMGGSSVFAAWRAAGVWTLGDRLERALAAAVLTIAQLVGIPLALGAVGVLSLPAVLVTHVLVAVAAWWWSCPRSEPAAGAPDEAERAWAPLDLVGLAAGVAYAVVAIGYSLRRVRSFDFDTKEYHLSNLASWLQDGSIWGLPYAQPGSVTATHPGNGELLGLWLALPTHGDELVYAAPALCGVLAIVASAVLVRELRGGTAGSAGLGALAAVAVLTAPLYLATQIHSLSTDLVASAGLLAALALLLVARRNGQAAPVVMAGVSLGLGMGAKYTAAVPAVLIALAAFPLLRSARRWLLLVPGAVGFAGPWFLRNLVRTGNPLFPQDLKVVSGSESPYDQLNTSMLSHVVHGHGEIVRSWADLGSDLVGPVALTLVAGVVVALVRRRSLPDPGATLVLALVAVGSVAGYLATPVTGGGPSGVAFIIASCFRYGLVAVLLSAALWAGVAPTRVAAASLALVVGWNLWRVTTGASPRPDVDLDAAVVAGLLVFALTTLVLWVATRRPQLLRWPPAMAIVGAGAVAVLLGITFVVHRNDRADQTSELEALVLSYGDDHPALVVGVGDLRALLGPRLERPLMGVARGGEAAEIPFADDGQMLSWVQGEPPAPADPALIGALDDAIEASGVDLLVVGFDNPVAYPTGWAPAPGWCLVGGDDEGAVYVQGSLLEPGQPCRGATS